jgi:hypothetical protein
VSNSPGGDFELCRPISRFWRKSLKIKLVQEPHTRMTSPFWHPKLVSYAYETEILAKKVASYAQGPTFCHPRGASYAYDTLLGPKKGASYAYDASSGSSEGGLIPKRGSKVAKKGTSYAYDAWFGSREDDLIRV